MLQNDMQGLRLGQILWTGFIWLRISKVQWWALVNPVMSIQV
jgi:hypothetical protein